MLDVLILNTAVADFRGTEFSFVEDLTGPGGLAKCSNADMPDYTQEHFRRWIEEGRATAGGPGNSAPLMAKAGLRVGVGVNLGKGRYGGLDAQGRFFHDEMSKHGIDMSRTRVHEDLPTGTTFIYQASSSERGGIVYFANANDDFDFADFRETVTTLQPKITYYMYSGLSERGDANEGRDLADFIRWCRAQGSITIVDSHTLTGNPHALIEHGGTVEEYKLLNPLLDELDLFFTSYDEAKLIENTLAKPRLWNGFDERENIGHFLEFLSERFWKGDKRTRLFGVTVRDGAYHLAMKPNRSIGNLQKTESFFLKGEVVDLTGAGDSFRAGLLSYIARHFEELKDGSLRFREAVQMGNLFAALYITAPLEDRYAHIVPFEKMLGLIQETDRFDRFDDLLLALHG